jgi:hypothetical protein
MFLFVDRYGHHVSWRSSSRQWRYTSSNQQGISYLRPATSSNIVHIQLRKASIVGEQISKSIVHSKRWRESLIHPVRSQHNMLTLIFRRVYCRCTHPSRSRELGHPWTARDMHLVRFLDRERLMLATKSSPGSRVNQRACNRTRS